MAWPSIGSESFLSFSGRVPKLGQTLEEISRYGENGIEYRTIGTRTKPTQHTTVVDVASASAAQSKETTYFGMKGTLVTVTYPDGRTQANVAVLDVEVASIKTDHLGVGGVSGGSVIVTAIWTLQGTA